ncbi:MAG: hypothetical protein AAFU68_11935, partial [Pseudomonadota bacterium]
MARLSRQREPADGELGNRRSGFGRRRGAPTPSAEPVAAATRGSADVASATATQSVGLKTPAGASRGFSDHVAREMAANGLLTVERFPQLTARAEKLENGGVTTPHRVESFKRVIQRDQEVEAEAAQSAETVEAAGKASQESDAPIERLTEADLNAMDLENDPTSGSMAAERDGETALSDL